MTVLENMFGLFGLEVGSGQTISGVAPVGTMCASSVSFLSSNSTRITNDFFQN